MSWFRFFCDWFIRSKLFSNACFNVYSFFFLGKYHLWPLCVRHGVTFEQSRSRWPDKTRKQKIEEKTRKKLSRKAHTERDILLWYMSKLYLKDAPPSLSRCAHTSMKRRLLQGERGGGSGNGIGIGMVRGRDQLQASCSHTGLGNLCASWSLSFDIVHRAWLLCRGIWHSGCGPAPREQPSPPACTAEPWPKPEHPSYRYGVVVILCFYVPMAGGKIYLNCWWRFFLLYIKFFC